MTDLFDALAVAALIGFAAITLMIIVALAREVRALSADLARADNLIQDLRSANERHIAGRAIAEATYLSAVETNRVLEERSQQQTHILGALASRIRGSRKSVVYHLTIPNVSQVVDLGIFQTIVWSN